MDFGDFETLTQLSGLSRQKLAGICGVSLRTYNQYCNTNKVPQAVRALVTLLATGFVGSTEPRARTPWHGWWINGEYLVTPEGASFTASEVRALPYVRALAHLAADSVPQLICDLERALAAQEAPPLVGFIKTLLFGLSLNHAAALGESETAL